MVVRPETETCVDPREREEEEVGVVEGVVDFDAEEEQTGREQADVVSGDSGVFQDKSPDDTTSILAHCISNLSNA